MNWREGNQRGKDGKAREKGKEGEREEAKAHSVRPGGADNVRRRDSDGALDLTAWKLPGGYRGEADWPPEEDDSERNRFHYQTEHRSFMRKGESGRDNEAAEARKAERGAGSDQDREVTVLLSWYFSNLIFDCLEEYFYYLYIFIWFKVLYFMVMSLE